MLAFDSGLTADGRVASKTTSTRVSRVIRVRVRMGFRTYYYYVDLT